VPNVVRRSMAGVALEQAMEQAASAAADGGFDGEHTSLTRESIELDEDGATELQAALSRLHDEMEGIKQRSSKRIEQNGAGGRHVNVVTMLFEPGSNGNRPG
jgi:molecular chaperone GrpE (heat shock protein)